MTEFMRQLELKHKLLSEVLALTRQQTEFIISDDTDSLLTNIGERQKLIDRIDSIQTDLPDREALRADQECMALIKETNALLTAIQERDAENEKAALGRMDDLRSQLRKVNEGRKTYDGYETVGKNQIGGLYINKTK